MAGFNIDLENRLGVEQQTSIVDEDAVTGISAVHNQSTKYTIDVMRNNVSATNTPDHSRMPDEGREITRLKARVRGLCQEAVEKAVVEQYLNKTILVKS